jgi:hypothetical protein
MASNRDLVEGLTRLGSHIKDMKTLLEIKAELERTTERRAELWHELSQGHDPEAAAEVKALEDRIRSLWDEERMVKARTRFGDRDEIIKRARHEERLARAA